MMVEVDMTDERAEAELLELIRLQDSQSFTLSITHDDGRWTVSITDLTRPGRAIGDGASFAEAWFRQDPAWLRQGGS